MEDNRTIEHPNTEQHPNTNNIMEDWTALKHSKVTYIVTTRVVLTDVPSVLCARWQSP